jgi:UDP-N-acetyl-D-glucosamine dehydrogenase
MKNVAVIGQGYVGLPLAFGASTSGYNVFGVDSNLEKVKKLKSGKSPIEDLSDLQLLGMLESGQYTPTSDFSVISQCEIVAICVPTPLTDNRLPDLTFLESALKFIGRHLRENTLILVESTIEPGTTRKFIIPKLEIYSNLSSHHFYISYSPERIDPKSLTWNLKNTPKLISGINAKSIDLAKDFYNPFVDTLVECSSLEIAESAKLLENSFRLINISFINEFALFCRKLGIDVNEIVSAASTKPYGFMPFYPSIGIGGHCIPVDPLYFSHAAKALGVETKFIDLADQVNKEMANTFIKIAKDLLHKLSGKKIIVVGVAYKTNISDVRETPVASLISGLKAEGAFVDWHDDLVKVWDGMVSKPLSKDYDLAILATPHDYIDLSKLGDVPILNTRGSI